MEIEKSKESNKIDAVGKVTGFFLFRNLINGYNEDKNLNEEERKSIKKYGVASIILSSISLLISLGCLFSTIANFEFIGFSYILMLIVFILCGVILSIILSIYAFIFAVMQVRLNRKSCGILGIILSILGIVSAILLVVLMVS